LLACAALALPVKLPLSQPMSFLAFALPILSPTPWGGVSRRLPGAELLAGVKRRRAALGIGGSHGRMVPPDNTCFGPTDL